MEQHDPFGSPRIGRRPGFRPIALTGLAAAVPLLIVAVAFLTTGARPMHFLEDPAAIANMSPLAGAVSVLGSFLWVAAGTCAIVGVLATPVRRDEERSFLVAVAVASMVMAVDDQFMVHEGLAGDLLGVGELWIVVPYLVALAALGVRFRRHVLRHPDRVVLALALLFLGFSLGLDIAGWTFDGRQALEEGAKFFGVAYWTLFLGRATLRHLRASAADQAGYLVAEAVAQHSRTADEHRAVHH